MTAPVIVYRPVLILQPLDDSGDPDGAAVDVSCDIESVELGVDTPTIDGQTFCGPYSVPGDTTESATIGFAIGADTSSRWSPMVGKTVEARVKDRGDGNTYRKFQTFVPVDPSLYGTTTPGEARTVELDFAVLTSPEWDTDGS
jgi:hypothetical protein